ncbi:MAG: hypothetical protein ACR2FF_02815 [Mycobacteriales bacterium]
MFVLIGTANSSTGTLKVGGVIAFAFAAAGIYIYFGVASQATGGRAVPLGRSVMR